MRPLMLTRKLDQDDWLAGFAHTWARRLAARVERLGIICLELGRTDLPANVRVWSMGKERGYGRLRELIAFRHAMHQAIGETDVIFAHMIPRYALIAAPYAKTRRLPLVLWYTHRQVGLELRLAHALADRVVTASPESFRLPSRKLTVLGHGVDTDLFHPPERPPADAQLVVAVGRISPIKHYEVLIDAAALLPDAHFEVIGGVPPNTPPDYLAGLEAHARQAGLSERFAFVGPLPQPEVAERLRRAALTVNLCPTGGMDKAVLEGMACGLPVVVTNRTFEPLLGEYAGRMIARQDAQDVAARLTALLDAPVEERAALGATLRARVLARYSVESLIERLIGVFEEVLSER
jgi:glycosyltransferase involved in cell wall biosynthesis